MATYQTIPFTYLIGWSSHNLWYYGVRYANGCHPSDLWNKYFTSSSYVNVARQTYGEPDVVQIRKTFNSAKAAIDWEIGVLRRLKLHENPNFLNKTCAGAIHYDEKVREKLRQSALGNKKTLGYTNEYRAQHGMKILTGKPKGAKHSVEARRARSERLKGKPVHSNFKRPVGIRHSESAKEKFRLLAANRPTFHCATCGTQIKGKMNWDRHLASARHRSQLTCT